MNLYKVIFTHYSTKSRASGIKALLLAENEEQVFDWIASEPKLDEYDHIFNSWKVKSTYLYNQETDMFFNEDNNEESGYEWYDEEGKPENFKNRMLRLRGEIEDESVDFSDSYYGITLYGWETVKENVHSDYSELIESGVCFVAKNIGTN